MRLRSRVRARAPAVGTRDGRARARSTLVVADTLPANVPVEDGIPNSAIAARLGISAKTVANYVSIVLTKLRVPDKERAAELARRGTAELH